MGIDTIYNVGEGGLMTIALNTHANFTVIIKMHVMRKNVNQEFGILDFSDNQNLVN